MHEGVPNIYKIIFNKLQKVTAFLAYIYMHMYVMHDLKVDNK